MVEYDKRLRASEQLSALGSELFGDEVSLYTGQTAFRHVDIDVPGDSALPVQLSRRLTIAPQVDGEVYDARGGPGNPYGGLANWSIEVPHIYGIFDSTYGWTIPVGALQQQPRCRTYFDPRVSSGLAVREVWSGNKVVIPGQGEKELLLFNPSYPPLQYPSDGRLPTWTTSDFDAFRCITLSGPQDEGFVMTTRAGVSYRFDVYTERVFPSVRSGKSSNPRKAVYLLASEVTDRHGNWVRYAYNGNGHPSAITASDGRAITLNYFPASPERLQSASVTLSSPAQTRTWTYTYTSQGPASPLRLSAVTLPDNLSTWQFDYTVFNGSNAYLNVTYDPPKPSGLECTEAQISGTGNRFDLRITHPSGAAGEFRFVLQRTRRAVPEPRCEILGTSSRYYHAPYIDAFRLTSKRLFDTDLTSSLWTYAYGSEPDSRSTRTLITQPDGSEVQHAFSSVVGATRPDALAGSVIEGKLLETTTRQGGVELRRQTHTYVTGQDTPGGPLSGYPFPSIYGSTTGGDDGSASSLRPLRETTITQQGVRFTRTHQTFDALARPVSVKRGKCHGRRRRVAHPDRNHGLRRQTADLGARSRRHRDRGEPAIDADGRHRLRRARQSDPCRRVRPRTARDDLARRRHAAYGQGRHAARSGRLQHDDARPGSSAAYRKP